MYKSCIYCVYFLLSCLSLLLFILKHCNQNNFLWGSIKYFDSDSDNICDNEDKNREEVRDKEK